MTLVENVQEIQTHPHDFGPKTLRLLPLSTTPYGLPVYGVSAQTLARLFSEHIDAVQVNEIAESIQKLVGFPCIVRSSGLYEDGEHEAHAGAFESRVSATEADIRNAITAVLADASNKLTRLEDFSLLIQPYKKPLYTGVFFTRDPRGSLLSLIAWSPGATPQVVSGTESTEYLFHRRHLETLPFPWMQPLVEAALRIESDQEGPQDIEWIYTESGYFIVQTRPITTIPSDSYVAMKHVEDSMPHTDFYLDMSGVAENYPHPTPLTYSLLSHLYCADGPISHVYTTLGIAHTSSQPFRLCNGFLYTDKEAELRTFFPSHSYFGKKTLRSHWKSWAGILTTYTNSVALERIQADVNTQDSLYTELVEARLHSEHIHIASIDELRKYLQQVYIPIFKTNLYASRAESRAHALLGTDRVHLMAQLLEECAPVRVIEPPLHLPQGNSLATEDTSVCTYSSHRPPRAQSTQVELTSHERQTLIAASEMMRLREYARIITAWCAHHTRLYAQEHAQAYGLTPYDSLFLTFDDLTRGEMSAQTVHDRKCKYEKNLRALPAILSTLPLHEVGEVRVISSGKARGYVVDESHLQTLGDAREYILFTETLRPDLVRFFPNIVGIVSLMGSTLSHLAIVARENNIPVIVDPTCTVLTNGTYMMDIDTDAVSAPHK